MRDPAAADRILVFARARGDPAPRGMPGAADGVARVGVFAPAGGTALRGPDLDYDLAAVNAAAPGFAIGGDLFAMAHAFLLAPCEAYLHRAPVPGCPDATRMLTALDMAGQDITGAGTVTAAAIAAPLIEDAGAGAVTVTGPLDVDGALSVDGAAEVAGGLTVNGATVLTDTLTVTGRLTAGDITATGAVAGSGLTFGGTLSVAGEAVFGAADGGDMTADRLAATTVSADSASFTTLTVGSLTVGSCSGC